MLGCNSVCPNCRHQFQCCPPLLQECGKIRRSLHVLSGGGLITALTPPPPTNYPPPQVSPSMPLAFILPPFGLPQQVKLYSCNHLSEADKKIISDTDQVLHQSGWYYENISFQEAHKLLQDSAVGTFLVRKSSDPNFMFSLSVQTPRGATSVRIVYARGSFRLDAQPHLVPVMPVFPTVVHLVSFYIEQSRLYKQNSKNSQVWVDPGGNWYSSILLDKPLRKKSEPPSLKHFARLTIHRAIEASALPKLELLPPPHTQLELPSSLTAYLSEYPFSD